MKFPFTASDTSISIFLTGRMHTLASTLPRFDELLAHLKGVDHDADFIENIIDRPSMVARLTAGAVTVVGGTVFYNGIPAHTTLANKLVEMLDAGFDATPWINFFNKIMENPSEASRKSLYDFLEKWKAPLTPDGDFIAFKYVREDYMDGWTGTFDNHPGKSPSMPRKDVDPDPDSPCSRGLHVCASVYLEGFTNNKIIVAVKVNPMNVVAVPNDHNHAKIRVCDYLVLSDVEKPFEGGIAAIESAEVYEGNTLGWIDTGDGYDSAGYDEDGFDLDGYDESGYDSAGYDETGYDSAGYDSKGNDAAHYYDAVTGQPVVAAPEDVEGAITVAFRRDGNVWTEKELRDGVATYGQRGFSKLSGIPRSTLQGWISVLSN